MLVFDSFISYELNDIKLTLYEFQFANAFYSDILFPEILRLNNSFFDNSMESLPYRVIAAIHLQYETFYSPIYRKK